MLGGLVLARVRCLVSLVVRMFCVVMIAAKVDLEAVRHAVRSEVRSEVPHIVRSEVPHIVQSEVRSEVPHIVQSEVRSELELANRCKDADSLMSKTPRNFMAAILPQLHQHYSLSDDPSKHAALTGDQVAALATCENESVFVAKLTPILECLICKDGDFLVNSECIKWNIDAFHGGRPDLFRAKCYIAHDGPKSAEVVQQARLDTGHTYAFGQPHEHLLDSVILVEAKHKKSDNKDLQQLCRYLINLPAPPSRISRGMLVDPAGFKLFEMTGAMSHKTATTLIEGSWETKGSREAIQSFMTEDRAYSAWDRLLEASVVHAKVELVRFLGSGKFGRVYEVSNENGKMAMKLVLDCEHAEGELRALHSAHALKCPVVKPGEEVHKISNLGGCYLQSPVGKEVDRDTAKTNLTSVLTSLQQLHKQGVYHGDARIRNLIQLTDGKFLWIDFLAANVSQVAPVTEDQKRRDFTELLKSLKASDKMMSLVQTMPIEAFTGFTFLSQLQQDLDEGR